jgi:hypothetical protein
LPTAFIESIQIRRHYEREILVPNRCGRNPRKTPQPKYLPPNQRWLRQFFISTLDFPENYALRNRSPAIPSLVSVRIGSMQAGRAVRV